MRLWAAPGQPGQSRAFGLWARDAADIVPPVIHPDDPATSRLSIIRW
jgi:hypothetical protein